MFFSIEIGIRQGQLHSSYRFIVGMKLLSFKTLQTISISKVIIFENNKIRSTLFCVDASFLTCEIKRVIWKTCTTNPNVTLIVYFNGCTCSSVTIDGGFFHTNVVISLGCNSMSVCYGSMQFSLGYFVIHGYFLFNSGSLLFGSVNSSFCIK